MGSEGTAQVDVEGLAASLGRCQPRRVPEPEVRTCCAARAAANFGFKRGRVASVPLIPNFASEGAGEVCELRNRDTSGFALSRRRPLPVYRRPATPRLLPSEIPQ